MAFSDSEMMMELAGGSVLTVKATNQGLRVIGIKPCLVVQQSLNLMIQITATTYGRRADAMQGLFNTTLPAFTSANHATWTQEAWDCVRKSLWIVALDGRNNPVETGHRIKIQLRGDLGEGPTVEDIGVDTVTVFIKL